MCLCFFFTDLKANSYHSPIIIIKLMAFVTNNECVYCAVRPGSLNYKRVNIGL